MDRLKLVKRHLHAVNGKQVRVGNVTMTMGHSLRPELIPNTPWPLYHSLDKNLIHHKNQINSQLDEQHEQQLLSHIEWMMKKHLLGQDILLYGPPGPFKRRIALMYAAITRHETEFILIHPDTAADSDLKQRREIRTVPSSQTKDNGNEHNSNSKQFLKWVDGCCVRAATLGRCLIIEGIEKAERNVLPVLNNLLENREMTLEDGRHIISATRYDSLLKSYSSEQMNDWGLLRAHEQFRVIALATPVPPYPGKPLDPPFRSRFQARYIDLPYLPTPFLTNLHRYPLTANLTNVSSGGTKSKNSKPSDQHMGQIANVMSTVKVSANIDHSMIKSENMLPQFNQTALESFHRFHNLFPLDSRWFLRPLLNRFWPDSWLPKPLAEHQQNILDDLLTKFGYHAKKGKSKAISNDSNTGYLFRGIQNGLALFDTIENQRVQYPIVTGTDYNSIDERDKFIMSNRCADLISRMIQCHIMEQDFIIVGPKSSSKTICIREFARNLNMELLTVHLFNDMTTRDFLQIRQTRDDGSTCWVDSPLVTAAKKGCIAVLDGLEWVSADVLAGIGRLLQDREITLPDNSVLLNHVNYDNVKDRTGLTDAEMASRQIYRVHPAFRVIATASVDSTPGPLKWFSQEMGTIFQFLKLNEMSVDEETLLLTSQTQCPPDTLEKVLRFAQAFRKLGNARGHQSVLANSVAVSTRQLVRLCKRAAFPDSDLYSLIHNICLRPFLPHLAKLALDEMLADIGIKKPTHRKVDIFDEGSVVRFGDVVVDKYKAAADDHEAETLIPYTNSEDNADRGTSFYSNTDHNRILRDLALDFSLGEHLLVIGNQGVGKNRLTDRFLELMRYPREYIQLHRDTTVQALLVQPVLEHGRIVYRDSPLIKAVRFGRVLVVDEADKAPVYITSILKSLVETGEMDVSDGRKIRRIKTHVDDIEVHPNFRMIVLANRPGFPFLGNDFFASIGQVFGTYPIENPSFESEVALLCQKAPSVSVDLIRKLVGAFGDLRTAFDDGLVSYPYSLRELIHLVSHLDAFPHDSIESVLRNVFDFDVHQRDFTDFLVETFKKHGIILNQIGLHAIQTMTVDRQLAVSYSEKTPPAISEPKHGKVDDKNEPHVGGNTWAGGTGGSDTAGLGGRGGPYRLDSGNPIKQLPDELKNNVPEHVLKAAREMGRDALKKKLQDIKMSPYESEVYTSLYDNVKIPIQQLKVILDSVKSKQKERVWIRNQIEGELDDTKLVEGITGEHSIYKRRGLEDQAFGVQQLPKRIKFVFDVSGSMYRFNSYDQRLTKSLETAALVMESLKGMEDKYVYDIVGHSGDSACIPFVKAHNPPKNEKEILDVLMEMQAHAQYCWSGDNTMNATMRAIQDVTAEPADDYYVIVLSDANLKRYGIGAEEFSNVIEFDSRVSTTVLFIGSIGDEAVKLTRLLPKGRAFVAKHSGQIPMFMKDIFSSIA